MTIDADIPTDVVPEYHVYDNSEILTENYCFCRETDQEGGIYVECSELACKLKWYHLDCLSMKNIPKGVWKCPRCKNMDHWCTCGRKGIIM